MPDACNFASCISLTTSSNTIIRCCIMLFSFVCLCSLVLSFAVLSNAHNNACCTTWHESSNKTVWSFRLFLLTALFCNTDCWKYLFKMQKQIIVCIVFLIYDLFSQISRKCKSELDLAQRLLAAVNKPLAQFCSDIWSVLAGLTTYNSFCSFSHREISDLGNSIPDNSSHLWDLPVHCQCVALAPI